jgi:hypothetical protein
VLCCCEHELITTSSKYISIIKINIFRKAANQLFIIASNDFLYIIIELSSKVILLLCIYCTSRITYSTRSDK